ncbi:hypothetical protein RintRC_3451 [Richelia intracellularis]|nr:hypothetical protein RintRC_3451 [Richelia intracellularis]
MNFKPLGLKIIDARELCSNELYKICDEIIGSDIGNLQ